MQAASDDFRLDSTRSKRLVAQLALNTNDALGLQHFDFGVT